MNGSVPAMTPIINQPLDDPERDTAWRNVTGAPEFSFTLAQIPEAGPAMLLAAMVPFTWFRRRKAPEFSPPSREPQA